MVFEEIDNLLVNIAIMSVHKKPKVEHGIQYFLMHIKNVVEIIQMC